VRPKYLFLLRVLGCAVVLFIFAPQFKDSYASTLVKVTHFFNPQSPVPMVTINLIYGSSLAYLTFLSLMLPTPAAGLIKRLYHIMIGSIVFLFADILLVQYGIFAGDSYSLGGDSIVLELYLCCKWLLPFLLWVVLSYNNFDEFFRPTKEVIPVADSRRRRKS
jgi:hypothetical protein